MPKADPPSATRRSARIASSGSGPAAAKEEAKPAVAAVKKVSAKVTKSKDSKAAASKEADKPAEDKVAEPKLAEAKPASTKEEEKEKSTSKDATNGEKPASANRGVLKLGSGLPKIVLQNEDGEDVDVSTLAGERGVVFFLYPRADTPGCTNQACGFRDLNAEIGELGYDVYGLSKDKPAAQLRWKTKRELNYHLLSDPESKLIKRLGAFVLPNNVKRSHFIFEKGTGKLIDVALNVKAADDPKNALKFLKEHHQ